LGARRFSLCLTHRTWNYFLGTDDHTDHILDEKGRRKKPVERLQLLVSFFVLSAGYGLQDMTLESRRLDKTCPLGMSRDEDWFALFELLSHSESFNDIQIYRLPNWEHFNGEPSDFLLAQM
jgi:hypothetical protein